MTETEPAPLTGPPERAQLWQWPAPPLGAQRLAASPPFGTVQRCRVETQTGLTLQGVMVDFDLPRRRLVFRAGPGGSDASLPFTSVRRLTLTEPLRPAKRASARKRPLPAAAQERDYLLQQVGDEHATPLRGRSAGHVESTEGLFLFSPEGDDGALCRVFVPRSAYSRCEFGPSTEELAARRWIASPARLLEALAQPPQRQLGSLGQSLLALGLLSEAELERELLRLDGTVALGEALVAAGRLSRANLQTALAHRMGFPLVDLERLPLSPSALARLPRALALSHRVLPLMMDKERLVVATDRPGRVLKLRQLDAYAQLPIAIALALKAPLLEALNRHCGTG